MRRLPKRRDETFAMLAMKYGKEPAKWAADCFSRAKRDFDLVRHWRKESAGRRHQVVRGRRASERSA